jgi:glycosidase
MYQVYPRNHSEEGTFRALEADLDRIRDLGIDIMYLLPVHPPGKKNRKGSLGSPYAIADYRTLNPELGTMEDFASLVGAIHQRGMKCVMDIVYNHTSPDSWLAKNHPEWFYRTSGGDFGNRIGEWWDVIDLDYSNPRSGLWEYQIETLKMWAKLVDGFRCDVAPLIPLAFWLRAREETAVVNPRCLWIAESVEPSFILETRARGMICHSDAEMFRAFDVCYDYDIFDAFKKYLDGSGSLAAYAEGINAQEYIYPEGYVKLRCLENHDQSRAAFSIPGGAALRNWTAFAYFQKGLTMIYAGQEWRNDFRPSLFERDPLRRDADGDISSLLRALYRIKKDPLLAGSGYEVRVLPGDMLMGVHRPRMHSSGETAPYRLAGIFSLRGTGGSVSLDSAEPALDGTYLNLIDGSSFRIEGNRLSLRGEPVIFRIPRGSPGK